jgi:hypothetical protein
MAGVTNIATVRDIQSMNPEELAEAQAELDRFYGLGMNIYTLSEDDYEEMAQYDPISYVSDDTIPTYIIHGLMDEQVNINQSDVLETKLIEYDIVYTYYKVYGGDSDLNDLAESERDNISGQIVYFIKTYYQE